MLVIVCKRGDTCLQGNLRHNMQNTNEHNIMTTVALEDIIADLVDQSLYNTTKDDIEECDVET